MWFKRRKKSEQDHALSESLRSLQGLLSETGRQEPQLDTQDDDKPDTDETLDGSEPGLAGSEGPALQGVINAAEPAPPEAGSRWQDLNLSFDAEPLIPKPAEPVSTGNTRTSQAPLDTPQAGVPWDEEKNEDEGDSQAAAGAAPADPSSDDAQAPEMPGSDQETDLEIDQETNQGRDEADVEPIIESSPSVASGEGSEAPRDLLDVCEADGVYDGHDDANESVDEPAAGGEPAEPVLTAPETPASDAADAPDAELELHDLDNVDNEPALPQHEVIQEANGRGQNTTEGEVEENQAAPEPEPQPATTASAAASNKQRLEDQLHLQLEPTDEPADADIPTLTQAVYVPDAPFNAPEPEPAEPARDTRLVGDIEDLRSRLRNVDLDTLSPDQQAQLHNDLSELLDKLE